MVSLLPIPTNFMVFSSTCIYFRVFRNRYPEVFYKKGVLKNITRFLGKRAQGTPFLLKLQAGTLIL